MADPGVGALLDVGSPLGSEAFWPLQEFPQGMCLWVSFCCRRFCCFLLRLFYFLSRLFRFGIGAWWNADSKSSAAQTCELLRVTGER